MKKDNIFVDIFYGIKHLFQKNKGICPRCGYNAFKHGFFPHEQYYCTKCHLWEPDWNKMNKLMKEKTK